MHGPPYCILLPTSALPSEFQTATCWSCDPVLNRLRLEGIYQLAEKDVPNFISQSRNYPVILFTYTIFNHLFRFCCVSFHLSNLRKSFLNLLIQIDFMYIFLQSINRFHVDFGPYITFTHLTYMILSILPLYTFSSPVYSVVNKI